MFKAALKHAVRLQLTIRNPADAVKAPRIKKSAITTLTIEQSATSLERLRGKELYWPVLLALTRGMRRGEILALRWRNVDLDARIVRIVETIEQSRQGIRFKVPKTEKTRAVVLPAHVAEDLRAFKKRQAKEFSELNMHQTGDTLIFCRYDNTPMLPTSLTHEFGKAIKKMREVPKVRFHDLRHSHATQLLSTGVHPKIAQERLGHSSITTTLDLYSHVTTTMQNDAVEKLDNAYRSAIKAKTSNDRKPG